MLAENIKMIISDGKLNINADGTEYVFSSEEIIKIVRRRTYKISDNKRRKKVAFKSLLIDIDKHFDIYNLDRAAIFLGISRCHFSKYFHKKAGIPFFEFLNHIRIAKSIIMINDGEMLIRDIAIKCGFNNIRNFDRVFKKHTGFKPSKLPQDYVLENYLIKN